MIDRIQLPGSTAMTTRMGFGCSNLLGDKTREVGLGLLHAAYEAGIRHYDVARVYNFGDSEGLVGEFAAGKRDKITIATKFGLMPRGGVAKMKGPVELVRRLMRSSSAIRKLVRRNVKTLTQRGQFDPATAQQSLETSLRALRTDYVDILLLHEASVADCSDEIFAFLERVKQEGKIRAYGCGSGFERVAAIAGSRAAFLQVAQFESSVTAPNVTSFRAIRPAQNLLTVTHGAMGPARELREAVVGNPEKKAEWSRSTGVDLADGANLYGALLAHALHANPGGMVLFRAAAGERIRATMRALETISLTAEQAAALEAIGREIAPGGGV